MYGLQYLSKLEGPIVTAESNVEKGRVEGVIGDGLLRGGDSGRGTDRSIPLFSKKGMEDLAYGGFVFDHENKKFRWPSQEGIHRRVGEGQMRFHGSQGWTLRGQIERDDRAGVLG